MLAYTGFIDAVTPLPYPLEFVFFVRAHLWPKAGGRSGGGRRSREEVRDRKRNGERQRIVGKGGDGAYITVVKCVMTSRNEGKKCSIATCFLPHSLQSFRASLPAHVHILPGRHSIPWSTVVRSIEKKPHAPSKPANCVNNNSNHKAKRRLQNEKKVGVIVL